MFVLYESHAIMKYVVESYGVGNRKAMALYPSDLRKRAILDQIMDWHHTNLRPGATFLARRRAFQGIGMDTSKMTFHADLQELPPSRDLRLLAHSLQVIEGDFLGERHSQSPFLGGSSSPTIADLSLFCELEQLTLVDGLLDLSAHPRTSRWMDRMRSVDGYKETHKALGGFRRYIAKVMANKAKKKTAGRSKL